ncbi:MAG TPA: hypothetical protein VGD51_08335, partial [Nocardioidaceae bacterium]
RFVHRVKTHGRWSLRQPSPGVFEWRSPHGYRFRVDHTGTHYLGKDAEQQGHDAEQQSAHTPATVVVELWHSPFELDLSELVAHAG